MPCPRLLSSATAAFGAVFATTLVWSQTAAAQSGPVYRCGDSYQQLPCEQGKAVDVADKRDAKQQQEAAAALAKDQRTAEQLRQERLAREKTTPVQTAPAGIAPQIEAKDKPAASLPECKLAPGHSKKPAHGQHRKDCLPPQTITSPKPIKPAKSDKAANADKATKKTKTDKADAPKDAR